MPLPDLGPRLTRRRLSAGGNVPPIGPGKRDDPAPDVVPEPEPTPLEDDPGNDVEPMDHPDTPMELPPPDVVPGDRPVM